MNTTLHRRIKLIAALPVLVCALWYICGLSPAYAQEGETGQAIQTPVVDASIEVSDAADSLSQHENASLSVDDAASNAEQVQPGLASQDETLSKQEAIPESGKTSEAVKDALPADAEAIDVPAKSEAVEMLENDVQSEALSAQASASYADYHTNMYRLYNPNSGEHFYTSSLYEATSVATAGWQWEGIGWVAPVTSSFPVFRLYNPNAGDHHYTLNSYERDHLVDVGWNYEGIGWYSDSEDQLAVYRQYNPNASSGAHNFTTSSYEDEYLGQVGWNREGTAWYATDGSIIPIQGLWLVTSAWGSLQRYWIDSSGSIAKSRLISTSEGSGYDAYATEDGSVHRGKMTYQNHVLLADNDGRLAQGSGWLETSLYDNGVTRRYYMEWLSGGLSGARLGMFTVDGVRYFGVSGEGYAVDNADALWTNGWWYSLHNGELTEIASEVRAHVNQFVQNMISMAQDDSHGYDQEYRWGERGDYDCSSLVIACLKQAGFDTGSASYTGNMRDNLTARGWEWRSSIGDAEKQPGVILLNSSHHTAAMISTTQLANASINENGSITGGTPGDQTGREILIRDYYDYPWDGVLIPTPWVVLS